MERYARNICIPQIGESGQKILLSSGVLIAGAGGLGSGVIAGLASVGVGTLGILDNDVVELSNLNRQFIHPLKNLGKNKTESAKEWVKSYNSDINTEIYSFRLDETNYKSIINKYDLIIDCFDSYESKFLLNKICVENGKILISGGVTEFFGQVTAINPGNSACLACMVSEVSCDYLPKGVISPAINVISSLQAMTAVNILLNTGDKLFNRFITFDALKMEFKSLTVSQSNLCGICAILE